MKNEYAVYLAWCWFLSRVPHEQWSEQVQKDFAGLEVCKTDSEVLEWLTEARLRLFTGPRPDRVMPRTFKDGDQASEHSICLTIDVRTNEADIQERIKTLIDVKRRELGIRKTPGRPEFVARAGTYRLASKPDVGALDICRTVLEALEARSDMSMREVGEVIASEYPLATKVKLQGPSTERDKVMSTLGSRYVKKVKAITEAVARGVFPA